MSSTCLRPGSGGRSTMWLDWLLLPLGQTSLWAFSSHMVGIGMYYLPNYRNSPCCMHSPQARISMNASHDSIELTRWWERSAAMIRPWLKIRGSILAQLTQPLDAMKALGIDAIKIFMPCAGGMADALIPLTSIGSILWHMHIAPTRS